MQRTSTGESLQGGSEKWNKRENRRGRGVCGGVKVRGCRGNRDTERERGADGALSLFTEWHHITTKFNLISTKLRQIHLDTASKKS